MSPLLSPGQFIVLLGEDAGVAMITDSALSAYYDGLRIAETRARDVAAATLRVLRDTFGRGVDAALPANSVESLAFYVEHYDGRSRELVQQLAACILTGSPLNRSGDGDGGQKARLPTIPPAPPSPVGATFATAGAAS